MGGFFVTKGSIQDLYSGTILIFIYSPYYFFEKEDFNYNNIKINEQVESISKTENLRKSLGKQA